MTRLVAVLVALAAGLAVAQTEPKATGKPRPEPKPQVIIFTPGDAITGEADSPSVVIIETPQRPDFPSFFKVRENFDDKLRDSVNEL